MEVDYKVKFYKNGFKIRDVIAENISMLTTQRSEFSAILANNDVDYLIGQLESKTAEYHQSLVSER